MSLIETIKERVSITELLSHYGLTVDRNGFTRCPFHQEKTPSMKVYVNDNRVKCFGCGVSSDQIDFVARMNRCNVPDAIRYLGEVFHLELDRKLTKSEKRKLAKERAEREREKKRKEKYAAYKKETEQKLLRIKTIADNLYNKNVKVVNELMREDELTALLITVAAIVKRMEELYLNLNGLAIGGINEVEILRQIYNGNTKLITREEIYDLARLSEKGSYRVYNNLKHSLSEQLSSSDYYEFCEKLANLLKI